MTAVEVALAEEEIASAVAISRRVEYYKRCFWAL